MTVKWKEKALKCDKYEVRPSLLLSLWFNMTDQYLSCPPIQKLRWSDPSCASRLQIGCKVYTYLASVRCWLLPIVCN